MVSYLGRPRNGARDRLLLPPCRSAVSLRRGDQYNNALARKRHFTSGGTFNETKEIGAVSEIQVGIIGGSGLYRMPDLAEAEQ
ncbi:hypothetical protein, partial [Nitrolancea hollandica]|uniref:hypothetical protein n=1 Tax=Nitrolancea hollandica TaxID=1206749 RepID=UPI000590EC7D